MKRVAINGFGRIGRCVLRALYEKGEDLGFQIVAINEPADLETIVYLTRFDSTHGRFPLPVEQTDKGFRIADVDIKVFHETDIAKLPWRDIGIDLVLECSGVHSSRADGEAHLLAGAAKCLFSQPATADVDCTLVSGVNDAQLLDSHQIVSSASCTTNCIVPVISVLDDAFSIKAGHMTTLHSMMNDQPVLDAYHHTDLRKTRSASQSLIPIETELALGIERILPAMAGRMSANAVRVPTTNVSAIDLVVDVDRSTTVDEVNEVLQFASEQRLQGILGFTVQPLASCDFNHDPRSGIVDAGQTSVSGGSLVKVLTWFDNEWGFANRMLEVSARMLSN